MKENNRKNPARNKKNLRRVSALALIEDRLKLSDTDFMKEASNKGDRTVKDIKEELSGIADKLRGVIVG